MSSPDQLKHLIHQTHQHLQSTDDLSPHSPGLTPLLQAFVSAIQNTPEATHPQDILDDPEVIAVLPHLHAKLSGAEYEMECFFARTFGAQETLTLEDLEAFWYRGCYQDLVAQERHVIEHVLAHPLPESHVTFVGAGPLPLSAIDMHLQSGAKITCIDHDPQAIALSRRLIDKLGLSEQITITQADGETYDYHGSDIVFVAALVAGKDIVMQQIHQTAPQTYIAVRTAEGLHTLLYPPFEPTATPQQNWHFHGKSTPAGGTINTTHFYSLTPRDG